MGAAEEVHPGPAEWMSFVAANGRIPFAADSPPCWMYSGWLRFLVLQAEDMGVLPKRWHYVFQTLAEGHVPPEPLPGSQAFGGGEEGGRKAARILRGWMDLLDGRRSPWERMRLVMEFLAYGFGMGEPPRLDDDEALRLYAGVENGRVAKRGVNSRDLLELFQCESDLFGSIFCESLGMGWNPNAFFPTPEPVVRMMVEMTMGPAGKVDQRGLTASDPCVGTGRMVLHAAQRSMRIFACDIDPMMVLATKINLAFFAPWGLFSWDDSYFDLVSNEQEEMVRPRPAPPGVPRQQLSMFNANITEDVKNKGRPRAQIQAEVWARAGGQMPLFGADESGPKEAQEE